MVSEGRGAPDRETNEQTEDDEHEGLYNSIPRRGFMKFGAAAAAATGLSATMGSASAAGGVTDMRDPSEHIPTVGGGDNYGRIVTLREADYNVWNRDMLLDALDDASSGDVVRVALDAKIDLTGLDGLSIDDGVTLGSGRGHKGRRGGMIYTDDYPSSLFKIFSDDVRISGLRVRGPRLDYWKTSNFDRYESRGVWLLGEDAEVDNCEFYGWPVTGIAVGSRSRAVSSHIHHNSLHNNALEGYGYGTLLYNGHSTINNNYFNMNRHAITGFGYSTNGYEARYNVVGPDTVSHAFDMHGLQESTSTSSNVAGGNVFIHHNTFQFTHDIRGRAQEAITIRGRPDGKVRIVKNRFEHDEKPDGRNVSQNGQAYRQNNIDGDDWQNVYERGNHFGPHLACSDVGHFRPTPKRPAWAYSPGRRKTRSAMRVEYENSFEERARITALKIDPFRSKIKTLADHSWGEGRWKSEVHVDADVRDGCCDLGGGLSLPGKVNIGKDGHSASPDVTPILSGRSKANINLCDFMDRHGRPVDMLGEKVKVTVFMVLDDGTRCRDEFAVEP